MSQKPRSSLRRPAEAETLRRPSRISFKAGSNSSSATAQVLMSDDIEEWIENRREAERVAREAAERKYLEEFGVPVDWDIATILVTHTTLDVVVYINVAN